MLADCGVALTLHLVEPRVEEHYYLNFQVYEFFFILLGSQTYVCKLSCPLMSIRVGIKFLAADLAKVIRLEGEWIHGDKDEAEPKEKAARISVDTTKQADATMEKAASFLTAPEISTCKRHLIIPAKGRRQTS